MALEKVPDRLLEYLKRKLETQKLGYKENPKRFGRGYETYIYRFQLENAPIELSKPLILRLNCDALREGTFQNFLVENDYPAARAHFICENRKWLGGKFIVMDFLPGKTLFESLPFEKVPDMLAEAHLELHKVDATPLMKELELSNISRKWYDGTIWDESYSINADWIRPAEKWIINNEPDNRKSSICHGDFNMMNVLIDDGRVSGVLDWSGVLIGEPVRDVASTISMFNTFGPMLMPEFDWVWFTGQYCDAYHSKSKFELHRLEYYEAVKCLSLLKFFESSGASLRGRSIPDISQNYCRTKFREISGISITK